MLSEDEKAIQFYKRFIETEEQELEWMYKEDEEYYRDSIEQKELLIKGWRNILNLITKLQKENEKYKYLYQKALTNTVIADRENMQLKEQIDLMAEYISKIDIEEDICIKNKTNPDWCNEDYTNCKNCIKQYFERKSEEC